MSDPRNHESDCSDDHFHGQQLGGGGAGKTAKAPKSSAPTDPSTPIRTLRTKINPTPKALAMHGTSATDRRQLAVVSDDEMPSPTKSRQKKPGKPAKAPSTKATASKKTAASLDTKTDSKTSKSKEKDKLQVAPPSSPEAPESPEPKIVHKTVPKKNASSKPKAKPKGKSNQPAEPSSPAATQEAPLKKKPALTKAGSNSQNSEEPTTKPAAPKTKAKSTAQKVDKKVARKTTPPSSSESSDDSDSSDSDTADSEQGSPDSDKEDPTSNDEIDNDNDSRCEVEDQTDSNDSDDSDAEEDEDRNNHSLGNKTAKTTAKESPFLEVKGGRPSAERKADLDRGLSELTGLVAKIAQKTGFDTDRIIDSFLENEGRGANLWNIYQQYVVANFSTEILRLPKSERVEKQSLTVDLSRRMYLLFKKDCGLDHETLLRTWRRKLDLEDSNTSFRARAASFQSWHARIKRIMTEGAEHWGFDSMLIACGRVVNQDQSLCELSYAGMAAGFFSEKFGVAEGVIQGHFRTHIYSASSQSSADNVRSKLAGSAAANNSTSAQDDAQAQEDETEADARKQQDDELRKSLVSLLEGLNLSAGQSWKALPKTLASKRCTIINWPNEVPLPHKTAKKRGIAGLTMKARKAWLAGQASKTYPLRVEAWSEDATANDTPVIQLVPESASKSPVGIFEDLKARLDGIEVFRDTSDKQWKPVATKKTATPVNLDKKNKRALPSDNSSDEDDSAPPPHGVTAKKAKTADFVNKDKKNKHALPSDNSSDDDDVSPPPKRTEAKRAKTIDSGSQGPPKALVNNVKGLIITPPTPTIVPPPKIKAKTVVQQDVGNDDNDDSDNNKPPPKKRKKKEAESVAQTSSVGETTPVKKRNKGSRKSSKDKERLRKTKAQPKSKQTLPDKVSEEESENNGPPQRAHKNEHGEQGVNNHLSANSTHSEGRQLEEYKPLNFPRNEAQQGRSYQTNQYYGHGLTTLPPIDYPESRSRSVVSESGFSMTSDSRSALPPQLHGRHPSLTPSDTQSSQYPRGQYLGDSLLQQAGGSRQLPAQHERHGRHASPGLSYGFNTMNPALDNSALTPHGFDNAWSGLTSHQSPNLPFGARSPRWTNQQSLPGNLPYDAGNHQMNQQQPLRQHQYARQDNAAFNMNGIQGLQAHDTREHQLRNSDNQFRNSPNAGDHQLRLDNEPAFGGVPLGDSQGFKDQPMGYRAPDAGFR